MGGRKDMNNKRQLSIIDETDYFSEEGQLQGQGPNQYRKWLDTKIDISNFISHNQLDVLHSPIATKCGFVKMDTSVREDCCSSCTENSCHCGQSDALNYLTKTGQRHLSCKAKLISPNTTINTEFDNQSRVIPTQNHTKYKVTTTTSDRDVEMLATHMSEPIDNSMVHCVESIHIFDSNGNYQTEDSHIVPPPLHKDCTFVNSKNSEIDFKNSRNNVDMKYRMGRPPTEGQDLNVDSIHEMFQILIKCIEGTQYDKQTYFVEAEAEDLCRGSPLMYLMEERVEKQPQCVNNIMSSFKEKFSLPNARRPPVRQKSRRTLALEKMAGKLKTENENLNSRLDDRKNEKSHDGDFEDEQREKWSIDDETTAIGDTRFEKPHKEMITDNVNIGGKDTRIERQNGGKVNVKTHDFQELKVIKENVDECLGAAQAYTQNCERNHGVETNNYMNSNSSFHQENSFTVQLSHSLRKNEVKPFTESSVDNEKEEIIGANKTDMDALSAAIDVEHQHAMDKNTVIASINITRIHIANGDIDVDTLNVDGLHSVEEREIVYPSDNSPKYDLKDVEEDIENVPCVEGFLIPTFKREGPKVYEEDDTNDCWNYFPDESSSFETQHMSSCKAKNTTDFLTIPHAHPTTSQTLQQVPLPEHQNQRQEQNATISKTSTSLIPSYEIASPNSHGQQGKSISFLNSNGSIARKPMLRHVSQPNMNALKTPQFPNHPVSSCSNQGGDSSTSQAAESKFQTKDLNSDLAKLKATAMRLNLATRRPSYLEWLEERQKNRLLLGSLDSQWEDESATTLNKDNTSKNSTNSASKVCKGDSKLERINGQCQKSGLMSSTLVRRHLFGCCDDDGENCCVSKCSSRRSSCNGDESSDSYFSDESERTNNDNGDDDDDDDDDDDNDNGIVGCNGGIGAQAEDCAANQCSGKHPRRNNDFGSGFHVITDRRERTPHDRLTAARKERIDKSLTWLRNELKSMRSQDQALARQLLSLRHEMHKLRLSWSCREHRDLLDEVQCDLEDFHEFSKVLDLPSTVYLDTPLKNVGVTRLNISARRFSTC